MSVRNTIDRQFVGGRCKGNRVIEISVHRENVQIQGQTIELGTQMTFTVSLIYTISFG